MSGKYHDQRVYTHFVHTYSRVPYLDREIFNVGTDSMRLSRRADCRANLATSGIQKVLQQSENLGNSLKDSRRKRQEDAVKFMDDMRNKQEVCLAKEKLAWSQFHQSRDENKTNQIRDQKYLDSILKSTSTKAESRLTTVRRWN